MCSFLHIASPAQQPWPCPRLFIFSGAKPLLRYWPHSCLKQHNIDCLPALHLVSPTNSLPDRVGMHALYAQAVTLAEAPLLQAQTHTQCHNSRLLQAGIRLFRPVKPKAQLV